MKPGRASRNQRQNARVDEAQPIPLVSKEKGLKTSAKTKKAVRGANERGSHYKEMRIQKNKILEKVKVDIDAGSKSGRNSLRESLNSGRKVRDCLIFGKRCSSTFDERKNLEETETSDLLKKINFKLLTDSITPRDQTESPKRLGIFERRLLSTHDEIGKDVSNDHSRKSTKSIIFRRTTPQKSSPIEFKSVGVSTNCEMMGKGIQTEALPDLKSVVEQQKLQIESLLAQVAELSKFRDNCSCSSKNQQNRLNFENLDNQYTDAPPLDDGLYAHDSNVYYETHMNSEFQANKASLEGLASLTKGDSGAVQISIPAIGAKTVVYYSFN